MASCQLCKIEEPLLMEDELFNIFHPKNSFTIGQIAVAPKRHVQIFEQMDDDETRKLAVLSKKLSSAVFDALNAEGTNILIQNGIPAGQEQPHFSLQVIPRKEDDKLSLMWTPRQLSDDDMQKIFDILSKDLSQLKIEKKAKEEKKAEIKEEKKEQLKGDSYMVERLRRMP